MPPGFDEDSIEEAFSYHKPTENQKGRLVSLRAMHRALAKQILDQTPQGAEQTLAIRKLEECSMWSNKAIALEPPGTDDLRPSSETG